MKRVKVILDYIVALCTIISCIVAVYGVFQVVNFVIDVRPIVVPLAQEVKEGNLDMKTILSGGTVIRHDTVLVTKHDTIYFSQDETQLKDHGVTSQQEIQERRLTSDEEARLDKSADNISKEDKEDIDNQEANFRQRMRNKMK